jgi:putative oxidoreductase
MQTMIEVNEAAALDLPLLIIRVTVGVVLLVHGLRHLSQENWGAGFFDSIGLRPGSVHTWLFSIPEALAGLLLILGLATPFACAGAVFTMLIATIANHWRFGFIISNPGGGYEYVLSLTLVSIALAGTGSGAWSLDHALGWFQPGGWVGMAIGALGGGLWALVTMVTSWRPSRVPGYWPS